MDISALILPGAQALVKSILTDGWTHARTALAHRWSKRGSIGQEAAEAQLEAGQRLAQQVCETVGSERALLEAYWAGYLAGLAANHEDLLDAFRELAAAGGTTPQNSTTYNSNTGQVGTLVQTTGDVHGGISIGR